MVNVGKIVYKDLHSMVMLYVLLMIYHIGANDIIIFYSHSIDF